MSLSNVNNTPATASAAASDHEEQSPSGWIASSIKVIRNAGAYIATHGRSVAGSRSSAVGGYLKEYGIKAGAEAAIDLTKLRKRSVSKLNQYNDFPQLKFFIKSIVKIDEIQSLLSNKIEIRYQNKWVNETLETVLITIFANLFEYTDRSLRERGAYKSRIELIDVAEELLRFMEHRYLQVKNKLDDSQHISDPLLYDQYLIKTFNPIANELVSILLPEIPIKWAAKTPLYYLTKSVLGKPEELACKIIVVLYKQLIAPIDNNSLEMLRKKPGGDKLLSVIRQGTKKYTDYAPGFLGKNSTLIAEYITKKLPVKREEADWLYSWLSLQIEKVAGSDKKGISSLLHFSSICIENILVKCVLYAGDFNVSDSYISTVVIEKIWEIGKAFYVRYYSEIETLISNNDNPAANKRLIKLFGKLTKKIIKLFPLGNDDPLKVPTIVKKFISSILEQELPKVFLDLYKGIKHDPEISEEFIGKILVQPHDPQYSSVSKTLASNIVFLIRKYLKGSPHNVANLLNNALIEEQVGGVKTEWIEYFIRHLVDDRSEVLPRERMWSVAERILEYLISNMLETHGGVSNAVEQLIYPLIQHFDQYSDIIFQKHKEIEGNRKEQYAGFASKFSVLTDLIPEVNSEWVRSLSDEVFTLINPNSCDRYEENLTRIIDLAYMISSDGLDPVFSNKKLEIKTLWYTLIDRYFVGEKIEKAERIRKKYKNDDLTNRFFIIYDIICEQIRFNKSYKSLIRIKQQRNYTPVSEVALQEAFLKDGLEKLFPDINFEWLIDLLNSSILPSLVADFYKGVIEPHQRMQPVKEELRQLVGSDEHFSRIQNICSAFAKRMVEASVTYCSNNPDIVADKINQALPFKHFDVDGTTSISELIKKLSDADNRSLKPLLDGYQTFLSGLFLKLTTHLIKTGSTGQEVSFSTLAAQTATRFIEQIMNYKSFEDLSRSLLQMTLPTLQDELPVPFQLKDLLAEILRDNIFPEVLKDFHKELTKYTRKIPQMQEQLNETYGEMVLLLHPNKKRLQKYGDNTLVTAFGEETSLSVIHFIKKDIPRASSEYSNKILSSSEEFLRIDHLPYRDIVADSLVEFFSSEAAPLEQFWPEIRKYIEAVVLHFFNELTKSIRAFENKKMRGVNNDENYGLIDISLKVLAIINQHFQKLQKAVKNYQKKYIHELDPEIILEAIKDENDLRTPEEQVKELGFLLMQLCEMDTPEKIPVPPPFENAAFGLFRESILPAIVQNMINKLLSREVQETMIYHSVVHINNISAGVSGKRAELPNYELNFLSTLNDLLKLIFDIREENGNWSKLSKEVGKASLQLINMQINQDSILLKDTLVKQAQQFVDDEDFHTVEQLQKIAKSAVSFVCGDRKISQRSKKCLRTYFKNGLHTLLSLGGNPKLIGKRQQTDLKRFREVLGNNTQAERLHKLYLFLFRYFIGEKHGVDQFLSKILERQMSMKRVKILNSLRANRAISRVLNQDQVQLLYAIFVRLSSHAQEIYSGLSTEDLNHIALQFGDSVLTDVEKFNLNIENKDRSLMIKDKSRDKIKEYAVELLQRRCDEILQQKRANRRCGKLMDEILNLVPSWIVRFLYYNIDAMRKKPAEMIGQELREFLKGEEIASFVKMIIESVLPSITESYNPDFFRENEQNQNPLTSDQILGGIMRRQGRQQTTSSIKKAWDEFQIALDRIVSSRFGPRGEWIKEILDDIFHKIFFDIIGGFFYLLCYPANLLINWVLDLIGSRMARGMFESVHAAVLQLLMIRSTRTFVEGINPQES